MSAYFFSIFFGAFVLEDLALASAITWLAQGKVSLTVAFLAGFLGIAIGDLGLYFIGAGVAHFRIEKKLEKRFRFLKRTMRLLRSFSDSNAMTYSVLISRAIPGTRFMTYFGAGFVGYSFWKFFALTIISVFVWVEVALWAGRSLQSIFMDHWILNLFLFLITLKVIQYLAPRLVDQWERKALLHSWRRWIHFEFWPAWLFYLPMVPYYLFLSLKTGSLWTPFYANPSIVNGGLIGESKWDFLRYLDSKDPTSLPTIKIAKTADFEAVRTIGEANGLEFPFIIKPDVGQRGFGVRILRNDFDLAEYLLSADFDLLIQRLSLLPCEAGLFYVRHPLQTAGYLLSITDKEFPSVVGDGRTKLGDLILRDTRARVIAPLYFPRLRANLDDVPSVDETVVLASCGNHCQGAVFLNGKSLITPALTAAVDKIAAGIPHFYFGRFDVRYKDHESLMRGENFEIVEVNGAGAEATHIWDARTKLRDAYKSLFGQWELLFDIGSAVRRAETGAGAGAGAVPGLKRWDLIKECLRVSTRKEDLSISS